MEKEKLLELLEPQASQEILDTIRSEVSELHPATLADLMDQFDDEDLLPILNTLDIEQKVSVFHHLSENTQQALATSMKFSRLVKLVSLMSHDDRVDLLQTLDDQLRETVMRSLAKAEREDILRLSNYEEGTAGAVMTSDYVWVYKENSVREAIKKIKREAPDKETIYTIYVLNENRELVGFVSLREIMLATLNDKVEDIMTTDLITAQATESQEEAAEILSKYDLIAIPVLDENSKLMGIITFDDVMDVLEEEATDDFHKMGSVNLGKMTLADAGVGQMIMKRLPWLLVLVFVNIFSGAGIAYYEGTIEAMVALVFFLPLLIGSAGNAGSQAAMLMVRALATGTVKMKDWLRLLGKEVVIAFGIGVLMALAVSGIGFYQGGVEVAIIVSVTMIIVVLFGSLIGMSLPFGLQKFNLDPATASAPLVTSIADICGVLIYFGFATWYLGL
ncbi:MAG: magnesium transporter [Balneolaceae bacterium]